MKNNNIPFRNLNSYSKISDFRIINDFFHTNYTFGVTIALFITTKKLVLHKTVKKLEKGK